MVLNAPNAKLNFVRHVRKGPKINVNKENAYKATNMIRKPKHVRSKDVPLKVRPLMVLDVHALKKHL